MPLYNPPTAAGTTSGTYAAGDDSRITGAAQKASNLSDLASASTSRTNLGLGTAATLASSAVAQTANNLSDLASATTARVNLGVTTGPVIPSGNYFFTTSQTGAGTSVTLGNGTCRLVPWLVQQTLSLVRIGAEVTTAGEAGSKFRIVIYADNGSGLPGALTLDAGQIAGDSNTVQELTISTTLTPGTYWVGGAVQSAPTTQPTMRTTSGWFPASVIPLGTSIPSAGATAFAVTQTSGFTGAAPNPFVVAAVNAGSAARIFAKTA